MNTSIYPPKNRIPDVNSPQVQAWVAEIDWSQVPNIPVAEGLPDVPHFPKCPPDEPLDRSTCWWSCAGCVAPEDVVTCPDKNSWGLTYDDGPSLATKDMMKYLEDNKLTATFFIVESRVLEYPDILKEQIAQGHHHIAMHSKCVDGGKENIVAEIRWSEKIIRDVTGLTMKYVRPPYGDTDNRVREILRQMGYTTVQEWEILQSFDTHLSARDNIKSSVGLPGGPVTLEHDLNNATIRLSQRLIPMAMGKGLNPMSLAHCLSDTTPYQHGPKLGPNGALEKITNGEGKGSYRGMPGMEEQDFKPEPKSKVVVKSNAARMATTAVVGGLLWTVGFAALASTLSM
ncbi:MAG: hypothetical protein J3Q66DRAFT_279029 [Benniella sp.]|nr:MAG: hypothetical protein J3Q66DRAFT_279029 [Benniella sp.]